MPPGVVTDTIPEAPAPTTAFIPPGLTTVKDVAGTPPKLTAVAPLRFVPVIEMVLPVPPNTGEKEAIVGGGCTYVNPGSEEVPYGLVTTTFPEAPAPTIALIVVLFIMVNEDAATPPKLTAVTSEKLLPVNVTVVVVVPVVGLKDVNTGGA